MSFKTFMARLKGFASPDQSRARELREEISSHIEIEAAENIGRGMDPLEARRAALVKFGNPQLVAEDSHAMWSLPTVASIVADIKFGWRLLWKSKTFATVAILTLALGIGATTAIFSVAYAVLIRPLPYPNPQQLVLLHQFDKRNDTGNWRTTALDYIDWRDRARSFQGVGAFTGTGLILTGGGDAEMVLGQRVSYNLFSVLGVAPVLGRDFRYEEEEFGHHRVVLLSHGLWKRRFGGDLDVIGRTISMNNEPYTVIGVMPKGFAFPEKRYQAWVPQTLRGATDPQWVNRSAHFLRTIGRLKPGVSTMAADQELKQIAADLESGYPDTNINEGARLESLTEKVVGDVRASLILLLSAAACLLLIACTNVANLLLARGTSREHEIAVRRALGAGSGRLFRQLLTENLLLSLGGTAAGVGLAYLLVGIVLKLGPEDIPRIEEVHLDGSALLFALAVAVGTGLLFGLAPLASIRSRVTADALRSTAKTVGGGLRVQWLRSALVVSEVAICGVLLIVAGLSLRSFMRLNAVNPGFNPDQATTFNLVLMEQPYPDGMRIRAFTHRLLEELSAMPGLGAVGLTTSAPLTGNSWSNPVSIEGQSKGSLVGVRAISPHYFDAMQTPLLRGRAFTTADSEKSDKVVIINESSAHKLFAGSDPIGQHVKLGNPESRDTWRTVIGVVADMHEVGLDVAPEPAVYLPYDQLGDPGTAMAGRGIYLVMRSTADPTNLISYARARIGQIDSNVPINDVHLLREMVSTSIAQPRFRTFLFACFGGVALVLAAVGIYGVLSYAVSQRTREFGIRIALGARRLDLAQLIVSQGSRLVLIGLSIAFVIAFSVRKVLESVLFNLSSSDPMTFALVTGCVVGIATLAVVAPARRAMKSDPMAAIRYE